MFNRRNRIPNQRTVKRLFSKGSRLSRATVFLFTHESHSRLPRFAVVCGLKVNKKATVRNRLKRVARAEIETRLNKISAGKDYLFVLRSAAMDEKKLRNEVGELLRQY